MELMRIGDVPIAAGDRVFRYSRARAVALAFLAACTTLVLAWVGWTRHSLLASYCAALGALALLLLRRFVLARFRPSNWLVRMSNSGLYVQLRSYLNFHFPVDAPTVVFLRDDEIQRGRIVNERRGIPDPERPARNQYVVQTRTLVVLELAEDAARVADAIAREKQRRIGTTFRHYPVRVTSARQLQIEWGVVPPARTFLDGLASRVAVTAPERTARDYKALAGLSRHEQEQRLAELAETGQHMAAVALARELFALDLSEATELLHRLSHSGAVRENDPDLRNRGA
jgi:hypothetical protein